MALHASNYGKDVDSFVKEFNANEMSIITEDDAKVHDIVMMLDAYDDKHVSSAIKKYVLFKKGVRDNWGWKLHLGVVPEKTQWRIINGKTYIWTKPDPRTDGAWDGHAKGKYTHGKHASIKDRRDRSDMAVKKSDMPCPLCTSPMFREPICRGCKEGKAGFRVRLICGENDEHTWIV